MEFRARHRSPKPGAIRRMFGRSAHGRVKKPARQPRLEALEPRLVLAGTWTSLAASGSAPPNGGAAMMLLSNGSVLVQNGSNPPPSANMFLLSPQANTGSYVNGGVVADGKHE